VLRNSRRSAASQRAKVNPASMPRKLSKVLKDSAALRQAGRWHRIRHTSNFTPDHPPDRSCRDGPHQRNAGLGDSR
jgi:hypothetical protein